MFICKLRKKLAEAGAADLIKTVWGQGYMVRDPSAAATAAALAPAASAVPAAPRRASWADALG